MSRWICLVAISILTSVAAEALAGSEAEVCKLTHYKYQVRKGVTAQIGLYEPLLPEGAVVMNLGPGREFKDSKMFIQTFCNHGFSVAAYDFSLNPEATPTDYFKVALKIAEQLKLARAHLPLISYGWSQGAQTAAALMKDKAFKRLVLENPALDGRLDRRLATLPKSKMRVFECRAEYASHAQDFKFLRGTTVLVPAHNSDCQHGRLSSMAEAQDPMGDFIESDFAGIRANNWYWRRI